MLDIHWLSQEAQAIHAIFESVFYGLVVVFLLLAVVSEFISLPIGGLNWSPTLIARVLIAAFLLHSYPEITNTLSDITDAISQKIGDFNNVHIVLHKMHEKLHGLVMSWVSVKEFISVAFSFITFFLLYISVFITNAGIVLVWVLLYVFSPLLIAFFVLPSTANVTKTLYRSLVEVCCWKIVWATLDALLWSSCLNEINKTNVNFLTVISFNLILAASLLFTPVIVNALTSKGLSSFVSGALGMAAGVAAYAPGTLAKAAMFKSFGAVKSGAGSLFNAAYKGLKPKTPRAPSQPRPPKWHKEVPFPTEAPGWLQAKLDQERNK